MKPYMPQNPTLEERTRYAWVANDRATLEAIEHCEEELLADTIDEAEACRLTADRDDEFNRAERAEGEVYGLRRVIEYVEAALREAKPLRKAQMVSLADLLQHLAKHVPTETPELMRAEEAVWEATGLHD